MRMSKLTELGKRKDHPGDAHSRRGGDLRRGQARLPAYAHPGAVPSLAAGAGLDGPLPPQPPTPQLDSSAVYAMRARWAPCSVLKHGFRRDDRGRSEKQHEDEDRSNQRHFSI
jgi:hypothetical protein